MPHCSKFPQEYLVMIQRNLEKIKNDIPEIKREINKVLYELYSPLSTTQKLKVAIPLIPLLATYEMETDVPKFVADSIHELKNLILLMTSNVFDFIYTLSKFYVTNLRSNISSQ